MNRRWVQEWCQQMDKLQKLQKSFICRFGWKDFPSYYKYIHSCAIIVLEKGGVLLLGTVLLLGHNYTVCLMLWQPYSTKNKLKTHGRKQLVDQFKAMGVNFSGNYMKS